jgi:phosphoribosylamine--glycine ligase
MRLAGDLVPALLGAARGDLSKIDLALDPRAAVGIVLAAEGYPAKPVAGDAVEDADGPFEEGVQVFHAGTALAPDGRIVTAGGRVLTVCALGADLAAARDRAYTALGRIRLRGGHYRRDIGLA